MDRLWSKVTPIFRTDEDGMIGIPSMITGGK